MSNLQFGLVIPSEFPVGRRVPSLVDNASRALRLVEGRFESGWVVDHLQTANVTRLESFTLLSYLAAIHPGFMFGHAVVCQSFRNPALVAKMAATLQLLTSGRFVLGMGAGGNEEEYRAYGYDFPPGRERVEQLEEAITIIKALWSEPTVTFKGKHHRVEGATCEPRPSPQPPLMIGAFRPRMLRLVAKHADWWNVSSSGPRAYARMATELERACAEVGRDPATIKRTWIGGVACSETVAEAEAMAASRSITQDDDDFGFVGTPDRVAAQMRQFVELGIEYFMLDAADFPELGCLELLLRKVLPAVNN